MTTALRMYQRLPGTAQSIVASARGLYLRWWRYGAITEELTMNTIERDAWSERQWRDWQQQRLAFVLERAARTVPYYRENWAARRRRGDTALVTVLENWPLLDKDEVRHNPRAFVADDRNIRWMFHEHTSGTTAKPLSVWWTRETVRRWYSLCEARLRVWNGVSRHDRWAILGGQLVTAVEQTRPPFWVWNAALHQLYLSSYHLSPATTPLYLDALKRYRVKYLLGYSSSLYELARCALNAGVSGFRPAVAITNAEPLFDYQRQAIAKAFDCQVRQTYGMAEIVAAASECPQGTLHLWPEVGYTEILNRDGTAAGDLEGDLVCTGLLNLDMPLIRYRVGDRAKLHQGASPCRCGRALPALASIEGRCDDVLYTADGRRVGRLDPVFKADLPVEEAQIIQESLTRVRVRYVPSPGFSRSAEVSISDRLRDRMGPVDVTFEALRRIPRTGAGKFQAVVCAIPPGERPDKSGVAARRAQ